MARELSVANYTWVNAPIISGYPFTLSCRFQPDSVVGFKTLLGVWNASIEEEGHFIGLDGDEARAVSTNPSVTRFAYAANSLVAGTWYVLTGRFISATQLEIIVNDDFANKGVDLTATNVAFGTPNVTYFGTTPYNSSTAADGKGADPALWDFISLDDNGVTALARGYSPRIVRKDVLFGHWPLWGNASPEPSSLGSRAETMTVVGTADKFEQPLVIQPRRPKVTQTQPIVTIGNLARRRIVQNYSYERPY